LQPKKRTGNKLAEKGSSSKATGRVKKGYIIGSVVIALILIIVGVSYYQIYMAPFHRTIIRVDDTQIRMDYFLKRAELSSVEPIYMIDTLISEQIIKLEAPTYGIEASEEDIQHSLIMMASGGSGDITESELNEWYRQQLNETGLSDAEYKEIVHNSLLAAYLHEYLAERVPTAAEQIHLNVIELNSYEDAQEIKARWEAGEDFADLAREASIDQTSAEAGGDIGWFPRGVMGSDLDELLFNLDIGDVSEVVLTETGALLFMVSEKAAVRELDEDSLQALKNSALEDWLREERKFHEISVHGLNNGYDSETDAWVNYQLSKMSD